MINLQKRREFLKFIGRSTIAAGSIGLLSCVSNSKEKTKLKSYLPNKTESDALLLAPGFTYEILIQWGDVINAKGEIFGYNNDFITLIPLNENEQLMWVNHESVHPLMVSGHATEGDSILKTKSQVDIEMKSVGGSIIHLIKNGNSWIFKKNSPFNRRLDAFTKIPFSNEVSILGSKTAIGTLANCAGGTTPWKTVLTCEENYQDYYGEVTMHDGSRKIKPPKWKTGWNHIYNYPPEHYGWVVEINPKNGKAKKLVGLGRFSHEGATCIKSKTGKTVVYMGDDANNQCFYKFISANSKPSLENGTLFVANFQTGEWLPLDVTKNDKLKSKYKTQLEMLIDTRGAAKLAGGTELDRPEDCEIDPVSGHIFLNCTNNVPEKRPHGVIYKIIEKDNDYSGMTFSVETFLTGGEPNEFSCPDNLAIDSKGNLWMTTDISDEKIGQAPYQNFGNNSLFYIPTNGPKTGEIVKIASGPNDSELTGPCFSQDEKILFLSVQHPGEQTKDLKSPTIHWPNGSMPKPAVVMISLEEGLKNI